MYCVSCHKKVIKPNYFAYISLKGKICRNCYTPTAAEGILTRTSERVRQQQSEYGADLVPPHTYDKERKRLNINPDFVKLYPENLNYYESDESVSKAGYPKLAKRLKENRDKIDKEKAKRNDVQFIGSQKSGMSKFVE